MIDRPHALPIARQVFALGISRSGIYYTLAPSSEADFVLVRRLDALHLEMPWCGACRRRRNPARTRGIARIRSSRI